MPIFDSDNEQLRARVRETRDALDQALRDALEAATVARQAGQRYLDKGHSVYRDDRRALHDAKRMRQHPDTIARLQARVDEAERDWLGNVPNIADVLSYCQHALWSADATPLRVPVSEAFARQLARMDAPSGDRE